MTITNYGELKTAVSTWAIDSTAAFTAQIPQFIAFAENRIAWGSDMPLRSEPVRVRDQEKTVDVTVTNGTGSLPSDFLEAERLFWEHSIPWELKYVSRRTFHTTLEAQTIGGLPSTYTIEGDTLLVKPESTGVVKLLYSARYPAFTDDADTNWLLQNAPGVYLEAALVEAFGFKRDTDAQAEHLQKYVSAADGVTTHQRTSRVSGQTLSGRARAAP